MRRPLLLTLLAVLTTALLLTTAPTSPASSVAAARLPVATPTVTPIPDGLTDRPFVGLLEVPKGYVEEEFLVSGTAQPAGGPVVLADGAVPEGWAEDLPPLPYTARMVVVRPQDPRRSNGAGVVTWHNVTFGHDIGEWFNVGREVLTDGWTYVEVSVQPASMPALKAYDPLRYAAVNLPGDAYAYDIYSQVAQALRADGLRTLVALGASQSGTALNNYLRHVQPRYEQVYDGFLVAVANGQDPEVDRPVIRLLSESEIDGSSASPDSRRYRQWEVAGAAHGSKADFDYIGAQETRDLGVDLVGPLANDHAPFGTSSCLVNRFPAHQPHDAALAALLRWIRSGEAPRRHPRVEVEGGTIVRDGRGNAIGGIRYPAIAVPTATYNRTGDCTALNGRTEPFGKALLKKLYPTRGAYEREVAAAVRTARRAGVLTSYDARDVLR